jgi:hypothetical protein
MFDRKYSRETQRKGEAIREGTTPQRFEMKLKARPNNPK